MRTGRYLVPLSLFMLMSDDVKALLHDLLEPREPDADDREANLSNDLQHHPPGPGAEESWDKCAKLAKEYDRGLCEAYREQIDTLLVFAGLFSAVVTAFTTESYQWLGRQPSAAPDQMLAQLLAALYQHNATVPPPAAAVSAVSDGAASRINTCWFLSLTLSLSSALVGILAKQWIREYERDAGRTRPDALAIRQMKFAGLEAWHVAGVVASVPLILQMALALFLMGVLELLWHLDRRVAIPVTLAGGAVAVFYLATTVLPGLQFVRWYFTPASETPQCPYKSPQAWLVLRGLLSLAARWPPRKTCSDHVFFADHGRRIADAASHLRRSRSWMEFDRGVASLGDAEAVARPEHKHRALGRLRETVDHPELAAWIWRCLWEGSHPRRATCRTESGVVGAAGLAAPSDAVPPFAMPWTVAARLRPRCVLLRYAIASRFSLDTCVGLLCQIYNSELEPGREFNAWACRWINELHTVDPVIDAGTCEALLRVLRRMAASEDSSDILGHTLCTSLQLLRGMEQSERRGALESAACLLTCQWLQGSGHLDDPRLLWRIRQSMMALERGIEALLGQGSHQGCTLRQQNIIVLALLAKAIDDAWLRLRCPETKTPERASWLVEEYFPVVPRLFRRLVAISELSEYPTSTRGHGCSQGCSSRCHDHDMLGDVYTQSEPSEAIHSNPSTPSRQSSLRFSETYCSHRGILSESNASSTLECHP